MYTGDFGKSYCKVFDCIPTFEIVQSESLIMFYLDINISLCFRFNYNHMIPIDMHGITYQLIILLIVNNITQALIPVVGNWAFRITVF